MICILFPQDETVDLILKPNKFTSFRSELLKKGPGMSSWFSAPRRSGAGTSEQVLTSLIVKAVGDSEDVGYAFVRCDDGPQAFQLLVVPEVSDPVGTAGGRRGNVPLDRGVTLLV